ncbi:DNA-deoxyinosine glycosylase [Methanoregula sp.]|uniref:DNA-deoxyinosine glycosylase n=1 Tax=Methanoregula sp. TaxID=2052170 RepID=UPI003C70E3FA
MIPTEPGPVKQGLVPVSGRDPVILILGSYPSVQSLEKNEYYGNPQNQFWKILEILFRIDHTAPYISRTALLIQRQIALWDVLFTCSRDGSADTAIRNPVPNDIRGFVLDHPTIRCIALNGNTAGHYFKKMNPGLPYIILPSTSSANARMTLAQKTQSWACISRDL